MLQVVPEHGVLWVCLSHVSNVTGHREQCVIRESCWSTHQPLPTAPLHSSNCGNSESRLPQKQHWSRRCRGVHYQLTVRLHPCRPLRLCTCHAPTCPYLRLRVVESLFSLLFRSLQQNVDNEKWFSLESEVALAKTLRRYLPYLELLSQAPTANAHPRIDHETRPVKVRFQTTPRGWSCPLPVCVLFVGYGHLSRMSGPSSQAPCSCPPDHRLWIVWKGKAACKEVLDPGPVLATRTTAGNLVLRTQQTALFPNVGKVFRIGVET